MGSVGPVVLLALVMLPVIRPRPHAMCMACVSEQASDWHPRLWRICDVSTEKTRGEEKHREEPFREEKGSAEM